MNITVIVLIGLILLVAFFFRDFKSVVYFVCILDILFRVLHKISSLLVVPVYNNFVKSYIPLSLESTISAYSTGILNTILVWALIFVYVCFLGYLIIYWITKN